MELNTTHKSLGLLVLGAIACLGASIGNLDPTYETRQGSIPTWLVESGQATVRPNSRISPGLAPIKLLLSLTGVGCFAGAIALSHRAYREDYQAWEEEQDEQHARAIAREARRLEVEQGTMYELEAYEAIAPELALQRATARFGEALGLPPGVALEVAAMPVQAEASGTVEPETAIALPVPEPVPVTVAPPPAPLPKATPEVPVLEAIAAEADSIDLGALIANYDGHLMLACRTGAGKTTTVLSALEQIHRQHEGRAIVKVVDPKQSSWAGLEKVPGRVRYPNLRDPRSAELFLTALREASDELDTRSQERRAAREAGEPYDPEPYYLVIDEENILLALAEQYDTEGYDGPKILPRIKSNLNALVLAGREDRVYLWIVGQSHLCQDAGFNGAVRDSFAVLCQGRAGNFQSIERAIGDSYLIPAKSERDRLQAKLTELRAVAGDRPIAFCSIGGYHLGLVPDLSSVRTRQFFATNPDTVPQDLGKKVASLETQLAELRTQLKRS